MKINEQKVILKQHKLWLNSNWAKGKRADFSNADLSGINLQGINLSHANFSNANLSNSNLSSSTLHYVNLSGAELRNAVLYNADLQCADISHADLSNVDLRSSNLRGANLKCAVTTRIDITHSILCGAYLKDSGISIYQDGLWTAYIQQDSIRIGCRYHSIDDWEKFTIDDICEMHEDALPYWEKNKDIILSIARSLQNMV